MPRIGNMTRTQFRRMKVADEPAQYRDNPSSYCEIVRITTFRILPAQPRVYKPPRLKLIGLGISSDLLQCGKQLIVLLALSNCSAANQRTEKKNEDKPYR